MQQLTEDNKDLKLLPLQIIFVLAIFQFVISFLTEPMMLTFDESMWQYIGRNWIRNGLVPYSGGIDNKSPFIFLVFGISDKLFGVNYWFPRLVGIVVQSVGIYGLYKIAERMMNRRAGLVAISFYGLSLLWRTTGGKYVSYTETYAITCIIWSVYYCIIFQKNSYAFVGGILAGLGLGFRFTAVFGIIPVFIFAFRRSRVAGLTFVLGIAASILVLILLAELSGVKLNEFIFFGFRDNFGAGSATAHSAAWKMQRFTDSFFYSELILFYPAIVFYFFIKRELDFFKVWLFSEFVGIIVVGMYDRSHFKDLLPVMSLMSAFAVYFLMTNYHAPLKQILLGLWIVFFPKTFEPLFAVKKFFNLKSSQGFTGKNQVVLDAESLKRLVGLWIRSKTIASDKVFVAGYGAQVQAYSERESPTIYFNVTQTTYAKKRLYTDLTYSRPAMMVIPLSANYTSVVDPDIQFFLRDYISKNYILDTCIYDYNIFRYNRATMP